MTSTAQEYYPPNGSDTNYDRHQKDADTDHLKRLMRRDITTFYNTLSGTGRRILAALIKSAPAMDEPYSLVISSLQHTAKCSKLSVLRTIPKGEKAGLFNREINHSGRRHGSVIILYKERCEYFISLFKHEYGLLTDTNHDWYQSPNVTNADRYQTDFGNRQSQSSIINTAAQAMLNSSDKADALFSRLSDQGKRVFGIICSCSKQAAQNEISLVIQSIAREAACSEVTVRRVIKHGHDTGIYSKNIHNRGPRFGIILQLNHEPFARIQELLKAFPPQPDTNADRYQASVTTGDWYHDRNDTDLDTKGDRYHVTNAGSCSKQPVIPCLSSFNTNSKNSFDTKGDRYQDTLLLDRQIKNLSNSEESEEERWARRLLSISTDDFQILWPRLYEKRFGPDQIRQIVEHRLSFGETILDIEESLHAARWELENGTFPEARKGICNYLFATLRSKGTWRRPTGFLTPNEQALANAKKADKTRAELKNIEKQKMEKAEQDLQNQDFESWLNSLSDFEIESIDSKCHLNLNSETAKRGWRKTYWTKNIQKDAA
ncbi:hypothetical protein [Desulfovibrio gilichinskyi]|uniref:Uncharacterized protein n=1 Tax=Desulfovibrio gilichinskyi TaxID=1519643 RepID=A0A1X7F1V4_9BACT|nr:hypothetical protein [Desulfovibrio gilichinskyi]SMF44428.1 hypothetical protein SAMN06295933_3598 [Desulfovibrio gilichinskyi]